MIERVEMGFCCCCFYCADVVVKNLLGETEKVLKLYESEVLQTEIRVLYELMYVLNNNYRNNKTFKALQQVRGSPSRVLLQQQIYIPERLFCAMKKYCLPPFRLNNA